MKPQITIDDIHRLDLSTTCKPEHPWQLDYIRRWVNQGKRGILTKMICQADQERERLLESVIKRFSNKRIDVNHVQLTDEQMEGRKFLTPIQVCYLRSHGLTLRATVDGLFLQPADDAADSAGVRARIAWIYLEDSWHQRQEEAAKGLETGTNFAGGKA